MKTAARKTYRPSMHGIVFLLGCAALLLFPFSPWTGLARAAQPIYGLTYNPETIFAGIPTSVLV